VPVLAADDDDSPGPKVFAWREWLAVADFCNRRSGAMRREA